MLKQTCFSRKDTPMSKFGPPDTPFVNFHGMISTSANMHEFFELVARVARTDSSVLIRGESGTGKELVARAIHNLSGRKASPFNAVNCAMLSPELVNSELFGHVKGSFTGAAADHKGYFEESHRGTLFLDEVAELPVTAQSRLLRVIQERQISRVGSTKTRSVDVRILSATHRALRNLVKKGIFREDLMYRLRVVPIFLPRLVDRGKDTEILAWRFIQEFNALGGRRIRYLAASARDALLSYAWPGNIRELRNNIENAFAVGVGETLVLEDLTPDVRGELPLPDADGEAALAGSGDAGERRDILAALHAANGNKGEAAQALGMSRSTLWRKMRMLGLP
jgi:two-component system response regulator AtoC